MARESIYVWFTAMPLAALLCGASLPTSASAQAPVYLTQWGSAGSGSGKFHDPMHVAADHLGNVYVQDYDARIQRFNSEGTFLNQWGGAHSCESGQFGPFTALATDAAGNLYVADGSCSRIQKFTATGTLLTEWDVPSPNPFMMNRPRAIAIDAAGALFVSYDNFEAHGSGVWKFTETGVLLTTWTYPMWSDPPLGLAIDAAGTLYATQDGFIKKYANDGTFLSQWSAGTEFPFGIAIDAGNNVYVSDWYNDRMLKFTTDGALLAQWGSSGSGDGQFNDPRGVAVDDAGNVYVVDSDNQRVQKFGYLPTPTRRTTWGGLKQIYR